VGLRYREDRVWLGESRTGHGAGDCGQMSQAGYRLYWRWKSKPGRPAVSRKIQALIRELGKENPPWGAERVREELLKLTYDPPCEDPVRKYMAKPQRPRKPSGTWLPFLRNHLPVAWAMDFCTVATMGFKTLHLFVILEHPKAGRCAADVARSGSGRRPTARPWNGSSSSSAMQRHLGSSRASCAGTTTVSTVKACQRFSLAVALSKSRSRIAARGRPPTLSGSSERFAESYWTT